MTPVTFGVALRKARKSAGFTLRKASEHADLSKSHLSGIENDKSVPGLLVAVRLTRLYGVGLDEIVAATEAQPA